MIATVQKLEDITNAVLEELTGSCAECGITSDIIGKPSFACYPKSPTHVTYRARLEGTSETDSGSLISLIKDWVSGGAGIIVTGVLMTVDSECSVAISSITERECSPPITDPTTSSTMTTMDPTTSSNMTTTDSTTNSGTAPSTDTTASTISQSSSDNTAAIIGGVVAVILIISIAITVIIIVAIVALVMKNRRGVLSIKKADK